ncbi:MAG: hypothetical protein ABIH50_02135 [bacterium]
MKLRSYLFSLIFVVLLIVSVSGCGKNTPVDVTKELSDASTKLSSGDLDGAATAYNEALAADPTNSEANFGAAMLGVLGVAVDDSTRTLVAKAGGNAPSTLNELFSFMSTSSGAKAVNFSSYIQTATTVEITPEEVQVYIKNTLIPKLDIALGRLAIVESDPNFKYILKASMTKTGMDRELDLGEIYALDMLGSFLKAALHEAIAYSWDYTTTNPLSEEGFAKLKADGAVNMEAARVAYARMMAKWIDGLNYIDAETDDQSDDLIPKYTNPSEKTTWVTYIGKIKNSLENGATTIDLSSTKSIVVNLKAFYTAPIADLKVYINGAMNGCPAGYDFTINGLFPGMTTAADWSALVN